MTGPVADGGAGAEGPKELRAVDRVRAAFQGARRSRVFPKWGDLEIFAGPITAAEYQLAAKEYDSHFERSLQLLVSKAEDRDGKKLFAPGDVPNLLAGTTFEALDEVTSWLYATVLTKEAAKAEIRRDPSSAIAST
jgi:hypothetical protein